MKLNKRRFWILAIPLILILSLIDYYANFYYPIEHITRVFAKSSDLKDVKSQRISVEQAKEIVMGWEQTSKVEDITPEEVFQKMGYQIFKDNEYQTYVIKNNKAIKIGKSPEMLGVMDVCVADLNADCIPELIYTYSYGSGYWCSSIGIMTLGQEEYKQDSIFKCEGYLYLDKVDNQCVVVKLYDRGVRGKLVGNLYMEKTDNGDWLNVKLRRNLSSDVEYRLVDNEN